MKYRQYRFKFYLNARHAIYTDGTLGDVHPHSWEILMHIVNTRDEFTKFGVIEEAIEKVFEQYQDKCLNDMVPFDVVNPTLENVAEYFKNILTETLNQLGWVLLLLEMSETPARTYVISLLDDIEMSEDQTINTFTDSFLEKVRGNS